MIVTEGRAETVACIMRFTAAMEIEFLVRRAEVDGIERQFRVYVPPDYDPSRAWPAVLFLHGAGERGSDSAAPTRVGIGPALANREEPYPAIVVFPQCPRDCQWSQVGARAIAMVALAETTSEFRVDATRTALTGISMGAAGAWLLAAEAPEKFVSLSPICGWVATPDAVAFARRLAKIPTWIFHGDRDTIVPVDASRKMVDALEEVGADVRYTELPGVAHNSWDAAYQKSGLLDWLISP